MKKISKKVSEMGSLESFYDGVTARWEKTDERYSQALFNHLSEKRPELANEIRGTENDPFYCETFSDQNFANFYAFIVKNWYKN